MAIPVRGLAHIRTRSGSQSDKKQPHRVYLRLSCLEMERARRGKERASAEEVIASVDARYREIEREKEALLESLASQGRPERRDPLPQALPESPGPTPFRLRY